MLLGSSMQSILYWERTEVNSVMCFAVTSSRTKFWVLCARSAPALRLYCASTVLKCDQISIFPGSRSSPLLLGKLVPMSFFLSNSWKRGYLRQQKILKELKGLRASYVCNILHLWLKYFTLPHIPVTLCWTRSGPSSEWLLQPLSRKDILTTNHIRYS